MNRKMPQIQSLRLKLRLNLRLNMPGDRKWLDRKPGHDPLICLARSPCRTTWLLALLCFGMGGRIETAMAITFTPPTIITTAYCGSTDMIPNCNLIESCGGLFSSPIDVTTSTPSNGACGYGHLRAETIEGSSGRRKLVCLDVSPCTGSSVCKYNKGSSGSYEIGFKCMQKD